MKVIRKGPPSTVEIYFGRKKITLPLTFSLKGSSTNDVLPF